MSVACAQLGPLFNETAPDVQLERRRELGSRSMQKKIIYIRRVYIHIEAKQCEYIQNIYNTVDQEAGSLESAQMEMYTMKQASQFKDNLSCRI